MKDLIEGFPKQMDEALKIGNTAELNSAKEEIRNVLICGLGGSGIGGSIVTELTALESKVPLNVTKGYFIPAYVNQNSLVIICSYSGNTEETVNALELAIKANSKIVCVTSGGKVEQIAKANKLDHILIPGGMPPRACLGYSLTQLFFILGFFKIINDDFKNQLKAGNELIKKEEDSIKSEAKKIAEKLFNKIPVIYTTTYYEGIAVRLRQQINENSKMLCWHHVFPEMNHNELVGWTKKNEDLAIIILRDKDEYARNQMRFNITHEVFEKYTSTIIEVYAKGSSLIEKAIYFINLGDWISWYLSEMNGVDATEIRVINHLKSELAKA